MRQWLPVSNSRDWEPGAGEPGKKRPGARPGLRTARVGKLLDGARPARGIAGFEGVAKDVDRGEALALDGVAA